MNSAHRTWRGRVGALWMLAAIPFLSACDQEEMSDQRKYEAYEASADWPNGMSARHPPPNTVARDARIDPRPPQPPATMALLKRGRAIFEDICAPCHGLAGDGKGMVVSRGFPAPPSFHIERLRRAEDTHFYTVIRRGYGLMYSYANRVSAKDRWAAIAYIRALQRSQHTVAAELPERVKQKLDAAEREAP